MSLSPQECIADLVSADDGGNLCVWKSGEEFQLLNKISGFEWEVPCVLVLSFLV